MCLCPVVQKQSRTQHFLIQNPDFSVGFWIFVYLFFFNMQPSWLGFAILDFALVAKVLAPR